MNQTAGVHLTLPPGLCWISDEQPGIRRQRAGKGFVYRDPQGTRVADPEVLARIRRLAIPPAWSDVWIATSAEAHLQATGRDARGRKQYRYHPAWQDARAGEKFAAIVEFARALPRIRRHVDRDLSLGGLSRRIVVATVVRILDETLLRIGNPEYAATNHSYGLTTVGRRHVRVRGRSVRFLFTGKGGQEVVAGLEDTQVARIVRRCQELPGRRLFTCVDESGTRHDVGSADVNEYLGEAAGRHVTAKDFRTWAATVLTAQRLGRQPAPTSERQRKRQLLAAIDEAAEAIGDTRAVCRRSYVHPAVIDPTNQDALRLAMTSPPPGSPRGLRADERRMLHFLREVAADGELAPKRGGRRA